MPGAIETNRFLARVSPENSLIESHVRPSEEKERTRGRERGEGVKWFFFFLLYE